MKVKDRLIEDLTEGNKGKWSMDKIAVQQTCVQDCQKILKLDKQNSRSFRNRVSQN